MVWTDATSMLAHQVKGAELSLWVDASSIAAGAILHQLSHYDPQWSRFEQGCDKNNLKNVQLT